MKLLTLRNTTIIMIKLEKFLKHQRVYCYFTKVVEEAQSTLEVVMNLLTLQEQAKGEIRRVSVFFTLVIQMCVY